LADAYYNRGTARFFLGKFMEACEDYQKSIDLNYIKKADAYFNRGLCFQKLDQKKKAYREFLKAKEMGSQKAIEIIKNYYTE
jgi:tetratricopeptide (TPR) repeat protein